ncbi:hypothetical protein N7535_002596 [Penicillium sp. DV-2018c]|nr:hypothetical protein N7535_002596 [Penicillium sp. DV-2018c]
MAANLEVFCCNNIRPANLGTENYRLGFFIYWAKAKHPPPAHRDENPGFDVPFCVGVHRKPGAHKPRHYVPVGWGEFAETNQRLPIQHWITDKHHFSTFRVTVYKRTSVQLTTPRSTSQMSNRTPTAGLGPGIAKVSPLFPASFAGKVPEQRVSGEVSSSSTTSNIRATGEADASTNLSPEAEPSTTAVRRDAVYEAGNLFSILRSPAGKYIISLLETAYREWPSTGVSGTRDDSLRMHVSEELRKLSISVDKDFLLWTRLFATEQVSKYLCPRKCLDTRAMEGKLKLQEIANHLREVSSQTPHDMWINSLVESAIARMMDRAQAEEDLKGKTEQPEEMPAAVDEYDDYDHCSVDSYTGQ